MLKKIDEHLEDIMLVALLAAMSLLIFVQVIMRYVFNNSLSWSEELARYMFVWMVYLAIGYAAKERKHIKIDAALWIFPKKIRPYIQMIGDLIVLVFSAFIIKTSFEYFLRIGMLGQKSAALGMPMQLVYIAPFIGFLLMFYRTVQTLVRRAKYLKEGGVLDD